MEIMTGTATAPDIDGIIRLYGGKEHFYSLPWQGHEEEVTRYFITNLKSRKDEIASDRNLRIFVARHGPEGEILAYLMLLSEVIEGITGQKQGLIIDYALSPTHDGNTLFGAMLSQAEEALLENYTKYLVIDVFCNDGGGEKIIEAGGFKRELNRIVKKVEMGPVRAPEPDPYLVRMAENEDLFFILALSSQCASFIIPSGRDAAGEDVHFRFMRAYSGMALKERDDFAALIIEDRVKEEPVGYLMFKFKDDAITGERLAYVYDIAIEPAYWGRRAAHRLDREGENYLAGKGIAFLLGDISVENQRALKTATRNGGYALERVRWLKKLNL
jgi:ribosomal protein S18 acetylase RimI-like enzyme